jgi:hypothetical protein
LNTRHDKNERYITALFFGRNGEARSSNGNIPNIRFTGNAYRPSVPGTRPESDITPVDARHSGNIDVEKLANASCLLLAYI